MKLLDAVSLVFPLVYLLLTCSTTHAEFARKLAHHHNKQANQKLSTQNPPTQLISNNKKMDPLAKGSLKMSLKFKV